MTARDLKPWEDQLREEVAAMTRERGYPAMNDHQWQAIRGREPNTNDAEYLAEMYTDEYDDILGGPPPRRGERQEFRDESPPAHWGLLWQAEMLNYRRLQQDALNAVRRGSSDRRDFLPEHALGSFLRDLADRYPNGEGQVISYRVEPSDEHPNGAADIGFHRDNENPLATVKRFAQRMGRELLLDESQCVSFLLSNRIPDPPWIRAIIRTHPGSFVNGQKKLLLTLEIRDPLLTTPEEASRFYSTVRRSLFGQGACRRPWRRRMVDFVKWKRESIPPEEAKALALLGRPRYSWLELVTAWNALHPEYQYHGSEDPWRSMYQSYRREAHSVSDAG